MRRLVERQEMKSEEQQRTGAYLGARRGQPPIAPFAAYKQVPLTVKTRQQSPSDEPVERHNHGGEDPA